jgi:hypothetical protein
MEIFLQYVLPYLVTISLTLLSGLITYKVAMAQSKSDMAKQREQFLLEGKNYIKNLHSEEKFKIYHSLMETALAEIQDTSFAVPVWPGLRSSRRKGKAKVIFGTIFRSN